jgi:hypothetical protein
VLSAVLAALAVTGTAGPASAGESKVRHHTLFSFADHRVIESSGLVDAGRLVDTINDSGDGPYVYAVDPHSGRTVGVTTYSRGDVTDVEAIAPGRGGSVWVGDVGDNNTDRSSIAVYHVPRVRRGDRTVSAPRFTLTYPGAAHDAETLLVDPRTQRLFVVTKTIFGGTVYEAPRRLHRTGDNRLRPVARVNGLVTDGTFFPDGTHVLLRTYGSASVYTFPDFRPVGSVALPAQRQGEGIAVGRHGRVLVSSEGLHSDVLQVALPAALTGSAAGHPTRAPTPSSRSTTRPAPRKDPAEPADKPLGVGVVLATAGLAGLSYLVLRGSRRRSPRRR